MHFRFPSRWVDRGGPSPHLSPLAYIYNMSHLRLENLHETVNTSVAAVTADIFQRTWQEIECRVDACRALGHGTADPISKSLFS